MVGKASFLTSGSTSTCAEAVIANAASSSASQAVFFLMMFPLSLLAGPEARLAPCHATCARSIAPACQRIPTAPPLQRWRPADDLPRHTHTNLTRTDAADSGGRRSHNLNAVYPK